MNIKDRIALLKKVAAAYKDPIDVESFSIYLQAANGDVDNALLAWEELQAHSSGKDPATLPAAPPSSLRLLNSLLDVTDGSVAVVIAIRTNCPEAKSLRQVALGFGKKELDDLACSTAVPTETTSSDRAALREDDSSAGSTALTGLQIRRHLFKLERSAVVQRMLSDDEINLSPSAKPHIFGILDENPSFDIGKTPVSAILPISSTFKALSEEERPAVESELKTLQRVQALAPVPEAIPVLFHRNLTSALQISNMAEDSFVKEYSAAFGDPAVATSVHRHATSSRVRNENFLISALQTVRGSGLRVIDGGSGKAAVENRIATFNQTSLQAKSQVNLERLFGTLDYCECSDCNSVCSPTAYFVELLEFLRHNNLKEGNTHSGAASLKGTQLEQLLLRRPDLQCIQLTCENANTLVPYIDLALEVMESYVVHAPLITAYNVNGETSAELLAQPHHTNREAYAILRDAVYPLSLPYSFALDSMRVFLSFLKSSRAELLRIFQPVHTNSSADREAVQRAVDSEFNLISQEEYVILTHQGFVPPERSDACHSRCGCSSCTSSGYKDKIRLRDPWEYFGYKSRAELLDDDPDTKQGLTWVKTQFLPRTGITYVDLVSVLKTVFVNPSMPTGNALVTMMKLRFSYNFLMYLVRRRFRDKHRRFGALIRFLSLTQPLIPLIEWTQSNAENPCAGITGDDGGCRGPGSRCESEDKSHCHCPGESEWKDWVYTWFEKVGNVIVLDSGEGPRLPAGGCVWAKRFFSTAAASSSDGSEDGPNEIFVGELRTDGGIVKDDEAVGYVTVDGKVIDVNTGQGITESYPGYQLNLYSADSDRGQNQNFGTVSGETNILYYYDWQHERRTPAKWSSTQDTCDIEKIRLVHIDGTQVEPEEYERMIRFLRLWKKMGWTIEEADDVISGLYKTQPKQVEETTNSDSLDSGGQTPESNDDDSTDANEKSEITVNLIHQLVAVKKLLDITGFPVPVLLTFWFDMPFAGEKSLYAKTFLTHNQVRIDPLFQLDSNDSPLTADAKITDHLPVIMAALQLRAEDIAIIRSARSIPDKLTLGTVSELYRYSKLLKFLAVRVEYLPDILELFGNPFTDADSTLAFLETWQKVVDGGFDFPQLNFLIKGKDNITRPLGPSIPQVLLLSKTIYDGLCDLDKQYPDVGQTDLDNNTVILGDFIPVQLALVYAPALASKISDLITGKYVFTTNAPSGLTLTAVPPAKVKYKNQKDAKPPKGQLTVTGILTEEEYATTLSLSSHPFWVKAVERTKKQAVTFYEQTLAALLPSDGATIMLKGDTLETPTEKGLYFLKYYIPFLRARLASQLVETTVSDAIGVDTKMAAYLLTAVRSNSGQSVLKQLLGLKQASSLSRSDWDGFLIPPVNDSFIFVMESETPPAPMIVNGQPVPFPHQSEDPSNFWSSEPLNLVAGALYEVHLEDVPPESLSWSNSTSPTSLIPASALLPSLARDAVRDVLVKLTRVLVLVQRFNLTLDEIVFFHNHGSDFASPDDGRPLEIDDITLGTWKRLQAYTDLRDKLPKQPTRLIELFGWAALSDSKDVVNEIKKVTLWDADKMTKILTGFDTLSPLNFKNELVLIKLQEALDFVTKTQIDVPLLFNWAKPLSLSDKSYKKLEAQVKTVMNVLRARYNASDWEQAARPLFDTLRKNQRDALVSYLVIEESLAKTGLVKDADSLFEYFLIDCQMSACLETSRIKQAIATVQLYVQRCLLGLEPEVAKSEQDLISRERWNWVKRYRVWEANRKVYLYPENWIVPSLRDDKSPFYRDFESQLQQKDVSMSNAMESLKEYICNVAYVANLKVYGLFLMNKPSETVKPAVLIAARRVNAPFDWYTREHSADGFWSPWVKLPVDIPNYDAEDDYGNSRGSGAYMCPAMWKGQPIIFFLQMVQKQLPKEDDHSKTFIQRLNDDDPSMNKPRPIMEIRLGYTLYQNGKWSQKQLSQDPLRHRARLIQIWDPKTSSLPKEQWVRLDTYPPPDISGYQMYPRTLSDSEIRIDVVYRDSTLDIINEETLPRNFNIGYFVFANGGVSYEVDGSGGSPIDATTSFQYTIMGIPFLNPKAVFHTFQADEPWAAPPRYAQSPMVEYERLPSPNSKSTIVLSDQLVSVFNHTFVDPLLRYVSNTNTPNALDDLYTHFTSMSQTSDAAGDDPFGYTKEGSYNECLAPYALYNWEIGLHAPMAVIDGLLRAQQFDDALEVCHKVFDPSVVGAATDTSGDNSKFWKFLPFKNLANTDAKETLEQLFLQLDPQTPNDAITDWRDHPFSPHAVARNRPVAYMKWIAMKYIEIMLAYGDYYFRQNSLETIPNAIQCYVIASHVYGPRGQKIPKRGKTKPQTYAWLLNQWDAFGNAVVQLELEFPFSNQTSLPIGSSNGIKGFANIFGFATSLYFCIPDNPKLQELRDAIDDRLSKIRNCMDINGVVRHLPLEDPPIDPALLVQAAAQGLNIDTVLNDLSGPIPNYRFQLLLQKAIEMCAELKSLGAGLLATKEKKDAEILSVLRASHETVMNGLTLEIRNRQLEEANQALDQLIHSRQSPIYKLQFYKFLVGNTDAPPGESDDFNEIPNPSLQEPSTEGELILIPSEQEEVQQALAAQNWAIAVGGVETLAAIFHAWPTTEASAKPMGVGAGLHWGGVNMGNATSAVARGLQIYATYLSHSSANAGRKAGLIRQLQDRIYQANTIGLELKNIDKQIATQRIRVITSQQEIKNQEKALDQVTAVEEFLKTKYTSEQLYSWIEGMTKSLYQQSYNLAFDIAKRAEKAFKFERPQNSTEYIRMGYWTNARDGLLAGEQLFLGLKRLEAAYQENLGHDFEMTKYVSVRQWAPLALIDFRESGSFVLNLPEVLFDMDCPGQYMRRITSVAVTIPCVVGPYTSINCVVRLLQHTIRTTPRASSKADYPQLTDGDDDRFSVLNVPISAMALSSAQNDNGRHELALASDRYGPFEGAGAISRWRFELPTDFRAYDYGTITDVVMQIRYTSLDGGDKLRDIAAGAVADYVKSLEESSNDDGLFMFFDLRADFASEWNAAFQQPPSSGVREMGLENLFERLPMFTRRTKPNRIVALSMVMLGRGTLTANEVSVLLEPDGGQVANFKPRANIKDLVGLVSDGLQMPMTNWKLRVSGQSVDAERLWLVVRYALTG